MTVLLLVIFFTILLLYAWFVEPGTLRIKEEVVELSPKKLKGPVRLLFLSDLHAGALVSPVHMRRKLAQIAARHAAMPFHAAFLGGDFVDRNTAYLSQLKPLAALLSSWRIPVYGVLGNHDYESAGEGIDGLVAELADMGVTVLRNQADVVEAAGTKLLLIGTDELESSRHYLHAREWRPTELFRKRAGRLDWLQPFADLHPELPRLLLTHNPDGAYLPGAERCDLVLAGHTHGGQYAPLDWISKYLPGMPRGSFITWAGRRLCNGTNLIVSRGFGGSLLPMRFLRPPEMQEITLVPGVLPKNLVIGLTGKPRSGKDTVASMIERILPGIYRGDTSAMLHEEYDAFNKTTTRHDPAEKERHRPGITAFINERRAVDPEYLVRRVFLHESPMMVTGIRTVRELESVHEHGGKTILLRSGHHNLRKRMAHDFEEQMKGINENQLNHITDWDYVIENNGTLLDLEHKVRAVLADILAKLPN